MWYAPSAPPPWSSRTMRGLPPFGGRFALPVMLRAIFCHPRVIAQPAIESRHGCNGKWNRPQKGGGGTVSAGPSRADPTLPGRQGACMPVLAFVEAPAVLRRGCVEFVHVFVQHPGGVEVRHGGYHGALGERYTAWRIAHGPALVVERNGGIL